MPIKNNARKALRQARARAIENKKVKVAYKQAIKDTVKAIEANAEKDTIIKAAQFAQKKLDKATKKGVIKANTASRKLSRLMKRIHSAESAK